MVTRSFKRMAYSLSAATLLCSVSFTGAQAAGFYIQEQSIKGLGYAFSGSATSIDDASTLYFNPAGMTKLDGLQMNAGVNVLIPKASVKNDGSTFDFNGPGAGGVGPVAGGNGGNPYEPTPVPNLYVVAPVIDDTLWAGIGVSAPYGLASEYDEDWFGRYDSTKTELKVINIQPSVAVKATEWLSIGGGVDIQYADAELKAAVSNIASEGESTLKGDDWSVGYNIGFQIKPVESTEIGIHYRSAISHTLDGSVSVEGLSAGNFDVDGTADLDLPDIATFGIAHDVNPDLRLMAQATWFGWNNFQTIAPERSDGVDVPETVQNYQTTWAFAVGAEYDLNDQWTVRGGYQFDETPTTDEYRTSRTPDGDRNWFSAGATYNWSPNFSIDMAATYIDVDDGVIDVSRNSGFSQTTANTDGSVGILALGVNYKF